MAGLSITVAVQIGTSAYFFGDQARLLADTVGRVSSIDEKGTDALKVVAERQIDVVRRLGVVENNVTAQQVVVNDINRKLALIDQKLDSLIGAKAR